jgi:mono/diheme cytochrome c family protein
MALLLASLALAGGGCGNAELGVEAQENVGAQSAAVSGHGNGVTFLDQGWDEATRAAFYQTTQGSRMLPYAWFINLEQPNGRTRFADAANLRRMGFIVDAPSATNPDGLPVGFARDVDPVHGDAVGLTCSACHTGELEYHGATVRIDGGQSLADLEQFQDGLLAALQATLASPVKFNRFAEAVLGTCDEAARAALRLQVEAKRDWWSARVARNRGASPHGPSRTDALGTIGNEVACALLAVPENCMQLNAPVQYPFLWNTPDFEWVQYTASVHSPIGRNVGEVTGVFAEASLGANGSEISTANIPNLHKLENLLKTLRSPEWPADVLGAIDMDLATEGSVIYSATCAGCHTEDPQPRTGPNAFGLTFAKINFATPLNLLGTDPSAAMSFATRRVNPGPWAPIMQAQGQVGPDGKVPVLALLGLSGQMVLGRFFAVNGLTDAQKIDYLGYRESRSPTVAQLTTYKARPLNGVAFTAPFLHNGSVQSIWELLLPAAQRMKQFYVGN